jgi:ATP-binding cassette subfamily F protein uup
MNYLRAENICKYYGDRMLFEQITMSIDKGQRIALIAKNGSGKTNLLNVLAGKDVSDKNGKVLISKDIKCAYLLQDTILNDHMTVWDTLFLENDENTHAIAIYERCLEQVETNPDDEKMVQALHDASMEMDRLMAWDYEARVRQILTKLDIHEPDKTLAQILIGKPDFLILDEPTNHLDIQMIEWLEGYLKSQDITLLLVTHDRYFLDNVCNEIVELENGKLYRYRGNYAYYIEQKELREWKENRETDKARNLLAKELEWMRRQPKARGTKSKARIEAFYDLKEKANAKKSDEKVQLEMSMNRLGGKIIELHHVTKSFGGKKLINSFSYSFKPGERVGIVGKNGAGKSTFLHLLASSVLPDSGRITLGETVKIGYYTQAGMHLEDDKRVIDCVKDIAEYIELKKGEKLSASQLLKRFLFDDKQQFTYVSKLSGGEKRRLYLLTILVQNPNFLILDEPTNDLDIATLNVLEDFLELYKGCVVLVTHDRYFMDKLVDHLFIFDGKGNIIDFNGNYQDYLDEQSISNEGTPKEKTKKTQTHLVNEPSGAKKKMSFKEQHELKELTLELEKLNIEKGGIEAALTNPTEAMQSIESMAIRLEEINALLDEKEMRWLELSEKAN